MIKERNHIKVFVSSTVYDFESQLDMVYSTLDGYGYDVMMSHKGTVPIDSKVSNLDNCLKGVENCDVFLGFIRPLTGTGILKPGEKSITAQEFDVAFRINMPRFVLADYRVVFARQFTKMMMIPAADIPYSLNKVDRNGNHVERPNRVVHSESLALYDKAIQNNTLPMSRKGNWVQEYKNILDVMLHVEAQFKNIERIKQLVGEHE